MAQNRPTDVGAPALSSYSTQAHNGRIRNRRLIVERLESRLLMAADPFSGLLSHGGVCGCPICSGQGLEALSPQAATAITSQASTWNPASAPAGVPLLNSRLGAPATLYLDFNGHVESRWGERTNIITPAYDIDGNYASFSALEVANIREIWARVAEDYAPFNINVTTVQPGSIADRVSARMAIGGNYSDWFGSSAGGVCRRVFQRRVERRLCVRRRSGQWQHQVCGRSGQP